MTINIIYWKGKPKYYEIDGINKKFRSEKEAIEYAVKHKK